VGSAERAWEIARELRKADSRLDTAVTEGRISREDAAARWRAIQEWLHTRGVLYLPVRMTFEMRLDEITFQPPRKS
jgi:hypothetical protein